MKLTLEQAQQKLGCQEVTGLIGREPYREPVFCGKPATLTCIDCGSLICIRCNLNCYECGEPLHEDCRSEHAKQTGHNVDNAKLRLRNMDVFVDRIWATGERVQ